MVLRRRAPQVFDGRSGRWPTVPFVASRPTRRPVLAEAMAPNAYPFFGDHQAGVSTPLQDHTHFAAFDMQEGATRRDLTNLLRDWSDAAACMTQGLPTSVSPDAPRTDPDAPRDDTGEALGLPASGLTITVGLGPRLFQGDGVDRFDIAAARPPELDRLPSFAGDALQADCSDGDLGVQVCADDPQVAVHAVRNLSRIAFGRAAIRWSQMGFGRNAEDIHRPSRRRATSWASRTGTNNILDARTRLRSTSTSGSHRRAPPTWLAGRHVPGRPQDRDAWSTAWDRRAPWPAQEADLRADARVGGGAAERRRRVRGP